MKRLNEHTYLVPLKVSRCERPEVSRERERGENGLASSSMQHEMTEKYPDLCVCFVHSFIYLFTCVCVLTGTVSGLSALLSCASRSSRGCWDWRRQDGISGIA